MSKVALFDDVAPEYKLLDPRHEPPRGCQVVELERAGGWLILLCDSLPEFLSRKDFDAVGFMFIDDE